MGDLPLGGQRPRGARSLLPELSATFAAVAWGLTPVGTRFLLASFTASEVISIRFSATFLISIFLLIASGVGRWPARALFNAVAWSLVGLVAYQFLVTDALNYTEASSAGIILGLEPLIVLIVDSIWNRRRPRPRILFAVLIGLLGVVAVVSGGGGHASRHELFGDLLILTAAVCWALYIVGTRSIGATFGSVGLSAISVSSSSLILALISVDSLGRGLAKLTTTSGLVFAFLVVFATVLGFVAWTYGSSRLSSVEVGLFLYLIPVASVAGGITLLGESLTWRIGLGAVLILLALVLSFRGRDLIEGANDLDGGVRNPLPLVLGHPELDHGE